MRPDGRWHLRLALTRARADVGKIRGGSRAAGEAALGLHGAELVAAVLVGHVAVVTLRPRAAGSGRRSGELTKARADTQENSTRSANYC